MFFRFLFICLLVYFGYRFIKKYWEKTSPKEEIRGKQTSEPLDLRNADVEDANFKDVENGEI